MTNCEAIAQIKWYFEEDDGIAAEGTTKEAANMAIKALEQPKSRWIPCSERLPEPDEAVLVSTKFGMCVAWTTDDSGDLWLTEVLVFCGDEVFAWMPLPERYKREKTDEGN